MYSPHTAPTVDFNYSPANPEKGESVSFESIVTTYDGATVSNYHWDFQDGNPLTAKLDLKKLPW